MQLKAHLLKKALIFSAFFYVCTFNLQAASCPPQRIDESVRVNYVYDGDTLQLEDGRKIRLMGIDTPEVYSRHGRIADDIKRHGDAAKVAVQKKLNQVNQRVGLAFGAQHFDRYQRTLAHVFLPDGTNLQAWLIEQGYAIAYTTPPNDRMSSCYRQQEALAIKHKRGIWNLPQYQLKKTAQLNKNSRGFHRLQAKVTDIWQGRFKVTLLLDERVEVKIARRDLINFNAHLLNNLKNKTVHIRGWLHVKNKPRNGLSHLRYSMRLRHPDAIKVLN